MFGPSHEGEVNRFILRVKNPWNSAPAPYCLCFKIMAYLLLKTAAQSEHSEWDVAKGTAVAAAAVARQL